MNEIAITISGYLLPQYSQYFLLDLHNPAYKQTNRNIEMPIRMMQYDSIQNLQSSTCSTITSSDTMPNVLQLQCITIPPPYAFHIMWHAFLPKRQLKHGITTFASFSVFFPLFFILLQFLCNSFVVYCLAGFMN